jgi:hypothetical protein
MVSLRRIRRVGDGSCGFDVALSCLSAANCGTMPSEVHDGETVFLGAVEPPILLLRRERGDFSVVVEGKEVGSGRIANRKSQ